MSSPRCAERHLRDVALVDLQRDAVVVERRDLEQHLAALDRRAEALRQVAAHDQAVERRHHQGARELLVDQRQLRLALRDLRADHLGLGPLVVGHGLAVLPDVLLALARELDPLELQLAVVEAADDLALVHGVARAQRRLLHVAVDRRGDGALHRALDGRVAGDAIGAGGEGEERGQRGQAQPRRA